MKNGKWKLNKIVKLFSYIFHFTISGPSYIYPLPPCTIAETNSTTDLGEDEKLRENCGLPFGFLYGLEIASVVTTTVLGILVNSLLGKYICSTKALRKVKSSEKYSVVKKPKGLLTS